MVDASLKVMGRFRAVKFVTDVPLGPAVFSASVVPLLDDSGSVLAVATLSVTDFLLMVKLGMIIVVPFRFVTLDVAVVVVITVVLLATFWAPVVLEAFIAGVGVVALALVVFLLVLRVVLDATFGVTAVDFVTARWAVDIIF